MATLCSEIIHSITSSAHTINYQLNDGLEHLSDILLSVKTVFFRSIKVTMIYFKHNKFQVIDSHTVIPHYQVLILHIGLKRI